MYDYPVDSMDYFRYLIASNEGIHSMGNSLYRYVAMKVPSLVDSETYEKIVIRACFDRSKGVSEKEKNGKLFNYMRPTAFIDNNTLVVNVFPGIDYLYHYGNILSTYLNLCNRQVNIQYTPATEEVCWDEIRKSNINDIPIVHTVIMGYVEGLQFLSNDKVWSGDGAFLWKTVRLPVGDALLLGCKHTYWGEIAGRVVLFLAEKGIKRIVYSGKLGALNPKLIPNKMLATGNMSILPNGKVVKWNNLFEKLKHDSVFHGVHATIPSVLQETKAWAVENMHKISFVDPEIGHMAVAANKANIEFSYLHIISDNLSTKFDADLSNERKPDVLSDRMKLCNIIGDAIKELN